MNNKSIEVYFSNAVENLASKLSDNIKTEQAKVGGDIFQACQVLVPNGNMAKFLQLSVTLQNGVCSNVEFPFLESGLWKAIAAFKPDEKCRPLNQTLTTQLIMTALTSEEKTDDFMLFYAYIEEAGSISRRKLWQLSGRLASLFLEYQLNREAMLKAWVEGRLVFSAKQDTTLTQLEKAQRALYLKVFGHQLRDQYAPNHATLSEYSADLHQQTSPLQKKALHIFTPSRLSHSHRQLFCKLSAFYHLHLYHLNVCCEFWQDMSTSAEQTWLNSFNQLSPEEDPDNTGIFELPEDVSLENELLKAWGKPGREALKMYGDIEDDSAHFNIHFENTWLDDHSSVDSTGNISNSLDSPRSLLEHLQSDILLRQTTEANAFDENEKDSEAQWLRSLQISEAPSIEREVDAVYNSILQNMREDKDLKLTDIVVLTPDMNKYRAVFEARFEASGAKYNRPVPYSLIDSNAATESFYARGIELLFRVIEDDFIRRDVFELFRNPCFQQACRINNKDVENWLDLCEKAGIYRAYRELYPSNGRAENTNSALFTWQQGLKRLRYGSVVDFGHQQTYIDGVIPLLGSNLNEAGRLSFLLERLYSCKAKLAFVGTPEKWSTLLVGIFAEFLEIPSDLALEATIQMSVAKCMSELSVLNAAGAALGFEDIRYYLGDELASIPAARGSYLSGGVVVASLQPMRPIPFKIAYVVGLDEKSFPGSLENDALDLRLRSRTIGDISRIESMNYLFLETLMCTRSKLYLSYVAQDIKTDAEILPSPVLNDIKHYLKKIMGEFNTCKLPLAAAQPQSFSQSAELGYDFHLQSSLSEWLQALIIQAQEKGVNIKDNIDNEIEKLGALNAYEKHHVEQVNALLTDGSDRPSKANNSEALSTVIRIDIKSLVTFLENPLLATLQQYGISTKDSEDQALKEDEPFALDNLDKWKLFCPAVYEYLSSLTPSDSVETIINRRYAAELSRSHVPVSIFAKLNDLYEIKGLDELRSTIDDDALAGPVVFGNADSDQSPKVSLPALTLSLKNGQKVELSGCLDNVRVNGNILSSCLIASSSGKNYPTKHLFLPFLFWCCLRSMDRLDNSIKGPEDYTLADNFLIHAVYKKACHTMDCTYLTQRDFECANQTDIKSYLGMLIEDYLQQNDDYLPFEICEDIKEKGIISLPDQWVNMAKQKGPISFLALPQAHFSADEQLLNRFQEQFLDKAEHAWGKEKYSDILQILQPTYPADAIEKYHRRFQVFYRFAKGGK